MAKLPVSDPPFDTSLPATVNEEMREIELAVGDHERPVLVLADDQRRGLADQRHPVSREPEVVAARDAGDLEHVNHPGDLRRHRVGGEFGVDPGNLRIERPELGIVLVGSWTRPEADDQVASLEIVETKRLREQGGYVDRPR